MGWIIAAAIILLLLILKISVRVMITDKATLVLGVGIFRIQLFPGKEKTLRLSDYKIKNFRKNRKKLEASELRRNKRKKKKNAKKSAKANPTKQSSDSSAESEGDIMELVSKLTGVARVFISRFGKHLHIKLRRLVIIIATPDAAQTAVLYGAVCGATECLFELLSNTAHLKLTRDTRILVEPDFTSTKTQATADITFSFRVWQLFDMLIRSGIEYLKNE